MAKITDLIVKITGDSSGLQKELTAIQKQFKESLGSDALEFSGNAATSIATLSKSILDLGLTSIKMGGDMQVSKKNFETLLGSAKEGEEFFTQLQTFATQSPFEFNGLQDTAKKLLAVKFAAQDIIPIMNTVGDTAAMLGSGQEGIDKMTGAITQMQAKGTAQSEEFLQLEESGVNAYKYLAESMGLSISEVMDKVSQGEVSSTEAINAIMLGMQEDFKGGMQGLSTEIPGLFGTIKDNVMNIISDTGSELIEALNLKETMQELANYLSEFSAYAKECGINEALRDLVPPELTAAVFILAGAIGGAAVAAMGLFGISVWTAMAPLLPFMAAGAAIAALAWVLWKNWEPISELFPAIWSLAANSTAIAWNKIQSFTLTGVKGVLGLIKPIAEIFGGELADTVSRWMDTVSLSMVELSQEAEALDKDNEIATTGFKKSWDNAAESIGSNSKKIIKSVQAAKKEFKGLTNNSLNIPLNNQSNNPLLSNPSEKNYANSVTQGNQLPRKTFQVSDSIEHEWVQITNAEKTEIEKLDIWKSEQLKALEETKAANENYQRDMERLATVYAAKRKKITDKEADEELKQQKRMENGYQKIVKDIKLGSTYGAEKKKLEIEYQFEDKTKDIEKYFNDIVKDYVAADKNGKKKIIENLKSLNIEYEFLENDKLDFSKEIADKKNQYLNQKEKESLENYIQCKDIQANIDEAYNRSSFDMLKTVLSEENAIRKNNLTAQQLYMDTWQEAYLDSQQTISNLTADLYSKSFSSLKTGLADVILRTKSVRDVLLELGNTILQVVANFSAQRLVGNIFSNLNLGGMFAGGGNPWQLSNGTKLDPTFGYGINMENFGAKVHLANGGITTGPTIAEIGEGRYQEAVMPLNKKYFEKVGIIEKEKGRPIIFNISTPNAESFRKSKGQVIADFNRALAGGRRNL